MSDDVREEKGEDLAVSLVRGDPLFRLQARLGLIPVHGLGLARRAIFWALLAWLPIAVWAWYAGRAVPPLAAEPLLAHFGVQVRCLVAIPLLILGEGQAHRLTLRLLPHFVRSGLVPESELPAFRDALASAIKLRNATIPWLLMLGAVLALNTAAEVIARSHEVTWAAEGNSPTGGLGFGAIWFLYVARPIHLALLVAWLWRILLLGSLFRRLAKLDLALVPTHPDKAAGLGFLEATPKIFAPVVLALGAVLAARWAHDVVYHGVHVQELQLQMGAFVVIAVTLFASPLLAFLPLMVKTKRQALLDYSALVGRHGRLVRERWVAGKTLGDDALLNAPELGPVADTGPLYDAVAGMRVLLIGKTTLAPLAVAAVLPLIPVLAIEIPVKQILAALAKAVI
jgi:hypothetical protein